MIISENQLRGQLAMWVARQSPYHSVDGVDTVGDLITAATTAEPWFGPPDCRMRRFESWRDLEVWLRAAVGDHEQLRKWNTARSGNDAPFVFVSRYGGPAADNDFIDIDALFRNVALHAWRESEADRERDARSDAAIGN